MHASILLISLALSADAPSVASLIDKLASPVQAERDAAAKELREVYKPSQRAEWEPFIASFKPGTTTEKEIKEKLATHMRDIEIGPGIGTGGSHMQDFVLDNNWVLRCWFLNEGDVLREATLVQRTKHIWVAPAADFNGEWIVYFVNGQPSHRIEYKDGKYHGTFTANHSDGSKSYVQHYGPDGADGEDTGYYPSGKVSYRAFYSKGKPTGTWKWFNEAGEVTSTQEH